MKNISFSNIDSTQSESQELSNLNVSVQAQIQGGINFPGDLPSPYPSDNFPFPINPSPTFPPRPWWL